MQTRVCLSFSKQNLDVYNLLQEKKNEALTITNYICEAIRFYEQYKETIDLLKPDNAVLDSIIDKIIKDKMLNVAPMYYPPNMAMTQANTSNEEIEEEKVITTNNDFTLDSDDVDDDDLDGD